jgi:hypothetical protein
MMETTSGRMDFAQLSYTNMEPLVVLNDVQRQSADQSESIRFDAPELQIDVVLPNGQSVAISAPKETKLTEIQRRAQEKYDKDNQGDLDSMTPEQLKAQIRQLQAQLKAKDAPAQWACIACTFLNEGSTQLCCMCDSPKVSNY